MYVCLEGGREYLVCMQHIGRYAVRIFPQLSYMRLFLSAGMISSVFVFVFQLPSLLWSYQPNFISGLAFFVVVWPIYQCA